MKVWQLLELLHNFVSSNGPDAANVRVHYVLEGDSFYRGPVIDIDPHYDEKANTLTFGV